jgi:hypothetical protein
MYLLAEKLVNKRYKFVYFYVIHLRPNLWVVKGKHILYMKQVDKMWPNYRSPIK